MPPFIGIFEALALSHILYNFGGTHLPKIPPVFKDIRGTLVPTLPHYLKILEVPTSQQCRRFLVILRHHPADNATWVPLKWGGVVGW